MSSDDPTTSGERAASYRPATTRFGPRNDTQSGAPYDIDEKTPNAARVYNALLGGDANFEADRAAAHKSAEAFPGGWEAVTGAVRLNRDFIDRSVRFLVHEAGVRQFLDLGTGVPDDTNVHAIAQREAPDARIVSNDYDPVVLAHAHQVMRTRPEGDASFILGDFRQVDALLTTAADVLDFDQPVAVMMVALMHLVHDADDPWALVDAYKAALPSGSWLAMTHVTNDLIDWSESAATFTEEMVEPLLPRNRAEFERFFEGFEIVEPGIVGVNEWRPDGEVEGVAVHFGAVGRKP